MPDTIPIPNAQAGPADPANSPLPPPSTTPSSAPTPSQAAPELTRRGKVNRWDRPRPPRDWRWWVGGFGRVLITTGLLLFGFVAYQLWGTGIETARAQRALESEFEELLAEAPDLPATTVPTIEETPEEVPEQPSGEPETVEPPVAETIVEPVIVPLAEQNLPAFEEGDAVARIEIPKIGVNDIVVAGVSTSDLKKGPGHFPDTPLPGQLGNAAIAGHRTTYGQPFHNVDKLEINDDIVVTTLSGTFVYKVTGQQIVSPSDYQVISTTDPTLATITLTSCHPKWTAQERIIISGVLDAEASAALGESVINYGRPLDVATDDGRNEQEPDDVEIVGIDDGEATNDPTFVEAEVSDNQAQLGSVAVNAGIADAFAEGWFSDPGAYSQVALWGLLLAAVAALIYLISRRFRHYWVGILAGFMPFFVALYFFYQNVNRLLPPNL